MTLIIFKTSNVQTIKCKVCTNRLKTKIKGDLRDTKNKKRAHLNLYFFYLLALFLPNLHFNICTFERFCNNINIQNNL